jgi:hypothetical protein
LREITEVYDEQARIREIDQAIGTGLLTDAEKERLEMEKRALLLRDQIRDTEDERDAAVDASQERIDALEAEKLAAEERLKAAELAEEAARAQLEIAQDQLEAAEALVDIQIDQNNLLQEQLDLLKKLTSGGAGAGGIEPMDWDEILNIEGLDRAEQAWADRMQGLADFWEQKKVDEMFANAEKAADNFVLALEAFLPALDPLIGENGALGKLNGAISDFLGLFSDTRANFSEGFIRHNFEPEDPSLLQNIATFLKPILDALKNFPWEDVGNSIVIVV